MGKYFVFAVMVMCTICCHGQHATDLTVGGLHARITELEGTVIKLLTKIEELTSQSASTNTAAQTMRKRGFMFGPSVSLNHVGGFELQDATNVQEVGFSLTLVENKALRYNEPVVFDNVIENIGSKYNAATGVFVCPASGTYIFALNIVCARDSYAEVSALVSNDYSLDNRNILNAVCDHRNRNPKTGNALYCGETQNGGTAIVRLTQGDKVTVKRVWPATGVSTLVGKGLTSFSGYLLRPS